jgi:hypothetical protein
MIEILGWLEPFLRTGVAPEDDDVGRSAHTWCQILTLPSEIAS